MATTKSRVAIRDAAARKAADKRLRAEMAEGVGYRLRLTRLALIELKRVKEPQKAFADILDTAENSYSAYETGKTMLPPDVAAKIRRRFGIDLNWIYTGDEDYLAGDFDEALAIVRAKPD